MDELKTNINQGGTTRDVKYDPDLLMAYYSHLPATLPEEFIKKPVEFSSPVLC